MFKKEASPEELDNQQEATVMETKQARSLEEVQAELEEVDRERRQFRELAQRAQADLANYRRRVEEEREDTYRSIASRIVNKLLPIMDDLQRALDQAPSDGEEAAWVQGIRLIERSLYGLLESEGVTPFEAEGKPFDPWEHEALMTLESNDHEPGTVVSVIRPGYKLHGKVLRPAQVAVAQGREPDSSEPLGDTEAHNDQ